MKKKVSIPFKRGSEVNVRPGSHKKYVRITPKDEMPGVISNILKNEMVRVQFLDEKCSCESAYTLDMHKSDLIPTGEIVPLFFGND